MSIETLPPGGQGGAPSHDGDMPSLARAIRLPVILGIVTIVAFFGVLGGWAVTADLAGGAVAPGRVSPEGSRKTVQHLEGGIIQEILARDGDEVEAGDPLMILSEVQAQASHKVLVAERLRLSAQLARLRSEQAGLDAPNFPAWLAAEAENNPEAAEVVETQQELFRRRGDVYAVQERILRQRISQLEAQIGGLREQIASQSEQLALIEEEVDMISGLEKKGLVPRTRLLALQREEKRIGERRAENRAAIARAQETIGETRSQIAGLESQRLDEVASELNEVQARLAEVTEQLLASEDVLERRVIVAPVSGTVVSSIYKTPGGVVRPGEPIMDIVPADDDLVIEARVSPLDIDVVHPGLAATVHLSAFSQRNLPRIEGEVTSVSADALTDENSNETYFRATVEVPADELAALGEGIELAPGMPAEVLIVTGERTMADYLTEPLANSLRRAFREN